MRFFSLRVSVLLFGSGFCALLYQIAWLRMLRLVFGSSTAATGVVLAIFMGGLGLGALWWGPRVDRSENPLRMYAYLELGVSLCAILSPFLIVLIRWFYITLGGTLTLGVFGGSLLRLVLSALLLGVPTFLMGGTLPAAVRAVEQKTDQSRRMIGLIYGANTIGAVAGSFVGTFVILEILGIQFTIICAALANVLIFVLAKWVADKQGQLQSETSKSESEEPLEVREAAAPVPLILLAAGIVGFAFLLMELVWYRMLAPLLGGSSYTFGLILSIALLGIGAGSFLYSIGQKTKRFTLYAFVATCFLEALFMIVPYAMGDQLALFAGYLRPLGEAGFFALVSVWTVITLVVVFPASVVAGYQFPLLVALLGSGKNAVGQELGRAYACNTLGSILGSLLGGLLLFPILSAPGIWKTTVILLLLLGTVSLGFALTLERRFFQIGVWSSVGACSVWLCMMPGPSAVWRHRPIGVGVGSTKIPINLSPNQKEKSLRMFRRAVSWEAEGKESSIALVDPNGYSFVVNGKSDGHARTDAPTQVMLGLIGSFLHKKPKRALVIGLGTGSTAGWLAKVPSIKQVDVVEFEPAILEVARRCAAVNENSHKNPKINIIIGDAREILLVTRQKYDIIVSEPSNPYRAGIASLFTQDFYKTARRKLNPGGIFVQWLQTYHANAETIRLALTTLQSSFPQIETWESRQGRDLVLLGTSKPIQHNIPMFRKRATQEPYRSALQKVWGVHGVEGFYTGFVASPRFAKSIYNRWKDQVNTDDMPLLEFSFARHVGKSLSVSPALLRMVAQRRRLYRNPTQGALDWKKVKMLRYVRAIAEGRRFPSIRTPRLMAYSSFISNRLHIASGFWNANKLEPLSVADLVMAAELVLPKKPKLAAKYIQTLRPLRPLDAAILQAKLHYKQKKLGPAAKSLVQAFRMARDNPWCSYSLLSRSLGLAQKIARHNKALGRQIFDALSKPFAVHLHNQYRLFTRAILAEAVNRKNLCLKAMKPLEKNFPWQGYYLHLRMRCYGTTRHPLFHKARADMIRFNAQVKPPFGQQLFSRKKP